jgi:carboxypeptidase PM20D1
MDVVPVPDAPLWKHPPFGGVVADGFVHGRGAIDDKHSLMAICEAVERLLALGFEPHCPVVLAFGHDEELGGPDGAAAIAAQLPALLGPSVAAAPARPLRFVLDEGLFLLSGLVPGLSERVAVICTGEKGHLNVELCAEGTSSHSSVPPPSSSIGALARAIALIEANPHPARLEPGFALLRTLVPAMPFAMRFLFGNDWLFAPLITRLLLARPSTAALLRTTTAVTMVGGGLKSNVMPPRATAIVNRRIHPADSVATVLARDARLLAGTGVAVRALEPLEPAPVSSTESAAYGTIGEAVRAVFGGDVLVAPGLMLGNTDTRHFWSLTTDIYRHCPTELTMDETKMFHGRDERIAVDNLARLAAFYATVIVKSTTNRHERVAS